MRGAPSMSFLKSLFSPKMQRATVIEHLIETLARRDGYQGSHCEHVKVLSFENVEAFMKDQSARVIEVGGSYPNESVLYGLTVDGKNYEVRASRAIDRATVLITSKFG